jgi:hypothetical protein
MSPSFLAQIATPPAGAIETWLLSFAAIASVAVLARKLLHPRPKLGPDFLTHSEFHKEMIELRDKIDAGFTESRRHLGAVQNILFRTAERRAESIHRHLTNLQEAVARLDERSKSRPAKNANHNNHPDTISY